MKRRIEHGSDGFNGSRRIRENQFNPFNQCSINDSYENRKTIFNWRGGGGAGGD